MDKKIKEIFIENKERYGYRRITLELRNRGYIVNHKKVYRIMVKLGLKPLKRNKRKYSSYKKTIGKIADNHINIMALNKVCQEKEITWRIA